MTKEALSQEVPTENPDWIPVTPEEVLEHYNPDSPMKSKIDELALRLAQEGKLFRLSPDATAEMDEQFRKDHEEFEREMNRRANIPVEPVYFPWHPTPFGPGGHWEDD